MPNRAWLLNLIRLLALVLLAVSAMFASLQYLQSQVQSWNPANLNDDPVSNWEARCEGVKADLPAHGLVGYISDWDIPGWDGNVSDMDNEFRLTQYALVPRILERGAAHSFVIGNFSDPAGAAAAETRFGLIQLHSYGLGIYLFANSAIQ